ncbi:MAG: LPS assembly lipoprotein LptE [Hyphomicrobiales bacterium]
MLGACQPLYGTSVSGESVKDLMAQVDVNTIPGRVGQQLRNELIFSTTRGGHGQPARYSLDIAIKEFISSVNVERTGDVLGEVYNLSAKFQLRRIENGEVVVDGASHARAAYDRYDPIFSNIRARVDAENRAARDIAENIRTRLAAYLSRSA